MSKPYIPPNLQKILEIFKTEFSNNLSLLNSLLEKLRLGQEISKKEVNSAINLLHKIKGGASFLHLTEIEQIAKQAEDYSQETKLREPDAFQKLGDYITQLKSLSLEL